MSEGGDGPETRRKKAQCRVTTGKSLHAIHPGNTTWARRFRDLYLQFTSDAGGPLISEAKKQLCRRAAALAVECEKMEQRLASGEEIDGELYGKNCDRLSRAIRRLGIEQVSKDQEPMSLEELLAARAKA